MESKKYPSTGRHCRECSSKTSNGMTSSSLAGTGRCSEYSIFDTAIPAAMVIEMNTYMDSHRLSSLLDLICSPIFRLCKEGLAIRSLSTVLRRNKRQCCSDPQADDPESKRSRTTRADSSRSLASCVKFRCSEVLLAISEAGCFHSGLRPEPPYQFRPTFHAEMDRARCPLTRENVQTNRVDQLLQYPNRVASSTSVWAGLVRSDVNCPCLLSKFCIGIPYVIQTSPSAYRR